MISTKRSRQSKSNPPPATDPITTEEQWLHESRRRFLKQAAVAGVGLVIAPALLAKRAAASSTPIAPAPGPSLPWHLGQSLYSGSFNPIKRY